MHRSCHREQTDFPVDRKGRFRSSNCRGADACTPFPPLPPADVTAGPVGAVIDAMNAVEDLESVKEEFLDEAQISAEAERVSLFDLSLVNNGTVEIDSSSGSGSSSDSWSDESGGPAVARPDADAFSEQVPEGFEFFKHKKSAILHRVKMGSKVAACGAAMNANFSQMPRVLKVRWPKCLKCFQRM